MNSVSEGKLIRATAIIERLERQVGTVIGGEWAPLSASQIEALRADVVHWRKPAQGISIMYENEFGKPLAESINLAFQAAGWSTKLTSGSGFGRGIEVGWGVDGINLKRAIETATGSKDVRIVEPNAEERLLTIIGVGAKVEELSATPHCASG